VDNTLVSISDKAHKAIQSALSINGPGNSVSIDESIRVSSSIGKSSLQEAARTALWNRLEKLMDSLHNCCIQIFHFQRVLSKLRDPLANSNASLLDEIVKSGELTIVQCFWKNFTSKLSEQLEFAAKNSPFIELTLIGEFPKLYRFFEEFLKRIQMHYEMKQLQCAFTSEEKSLFLNSVAHFRNSYLHRSFVRLSEAINKAFPSNSVPSSEDTASIVALVISELDQSKSSASEDFTLAVARGIAKALKYFASKADSLIATDTSALQIPIENISASQLRNVKLYNVLVQLHSSLSMSISLSFPSVTPINESLAELQRVGEHIFLPLFGKMTKHLEQIIYTMNKEDFGGDAVNEPELNQPCSSYMRQLQTQTQLFWDQLLSRLTVPSQTSSRWQTRPVRALAERVLVLFVRHAALVRPLGEGGRLRLAADMAQAEFAVAPLVPASELGLAYRALRAFRPLLFRELQHLSSCPELRALVPCDVLHHLFSRGPPMLRSPHVFRGWSVAQYSEFIDHNSQEKIWQMIIKPSLDAYVVLVNARGDKQFCPIYPILLSLGQMLISEWKQQQQKQQQ